MTESAASVPRLVVGYIATDRGRDAISLAISIARSVEIELVVTIIRPESSTFHAAGSIPKDGTGIVAQQLDEWLEEALALIPDDIAARGVIHTASNESKGLMEVASDEGAVAIVIGARATTLMRQFRIGTVATSLLHSSEVPVVLAPAGRSDIGPVSRITTLFGARPGAAALIGSAIEAATAFDVDLRLVALIENDGMAEDEIAEVTEFAEEYGGAVLAARASDLFASGRATVVSEGGADIEEAAESVEWISGELAFIGSSRLGHGRVFIGARARRLLRVLPVPVVVIPRRTLSRADDATGPDTSARADGDAQAAASEQP
ncbi:universal stress protein [Brevibacterium casei]|uniref:universal stress protein n=1 Tax=Brevibacterium casei TaxID=33889 RepID=UPI001919CC69|nr:universal stress protein [Brevibacterium casei]QQT68353.1 universal stress protein [Brevibacterium casei]